MCGINPIKHTHFYPVDFYNFKKMFFLSLSTMLGLVFRVYHIIILADAHPFRSSQESEDTPQFMAVSDGESDGKSPNLRL